ncbi:hypothetical protein EFQ99_34755 [Rhizobium vallis]|uniref:Uncharacterized protein n=1 Tax=Rhizobium vallis TaxID=634290 RepID=A0A3S0T0K1_9HYPH|nr:hypothetical protein EFQ99_34755 [Rhizobium vallis]
MGAFQKPENSSIRWSNVWERFKDRRGSNRRRMKIQWQVICSRCCTRSQFQRPRHGAIGNKVPISLVNSGGATSPPP